MSKHFPKQEIICTKCKRHFMLLDCIYRARKKVSKSGQLFCSSRCSALGDVGEIAANWRGGATKKHDSRYYRKKFPEKYRARTMITNGVAYGKIIKHPCKICNSFKSESHHPDYLKPLEIIWLCRKHHGETRKGVKLNYG